MKKFVLAALALGISASSAFATDPNQYGWTIRMLLGGTYEAPQSFNGSFYSMNLGYNGGIAAQYAITDNLAVDADIFRTNNVYTGYDPNALIATTGMVDALVHYDNLGPVELYGGVGLGVINLFDYKDTNASVWTYGGQVKIGAGYNISNSFAIVTEYRYQLAVTSSGTPAIGYNSHNLSAGLEFKF